MKRRRLVVRAGTVLLSGLLVAGLANLWVAYNLPLGTPLFQIDEDLLFTTRPGARRMLVMDPRTGGEWVSTQLNSEGFRGRELPGVKAGSRVVVIGDSLVLGENVALEDTFVEQLGRQLELAGMCEVDVVNAGVTGYGPDQALLKLEREVDRLQPDTVLLVLCATNDFGDLMRNKQFEVDAAGHLVRFASRLDPVAIEQFARAERRGRRWALVRLWEQVRAGRRARALLQERTGKAGRAGGPDYIGEYLQASRAHYVEFVVQRDPHVYSLFEDTYDADVAIYPEWDSSRAKVRLMGAVLERLAELCERRGTLLRALIVPSAVDLCVGFEIRVDPARWPSYSRRRLSDTLARLLERSQIPGLDLFDSFAASGPEALFVGAGDIHWNAAGQRRAAQECAGFLLEQGSGD